MNVFKAGDVFRFAIRIEEDGEIFYRRAALAAEEKEVTDLFNRLAGEEVLHKKTFQDLLAQIEEEPPRETYQGEYMAYLKDHIDNKAVFSKDVKAQQKEVHGALSTIEFALGRELDSILYYQEVKQFVPQRQHSLIDKIIEEERKHVAVLGEVRKKFLKA
jgi:rubrerythrin